MKHLVKILLVVLTLNSTQSIAQKLKIGIIGGASFANFINHKDIVHSLGAYDTTPIGGQLPAPTSDDSGLRYSTSFFGDMKTGFYSGVYLDLAINNRWTLETGLTFSQKGINLYYSNSSKSTDNSTTTNYIVARKVSNDYLVVPAIFKYKPGTQKRFYTITGVYSGLLIATRALIGNYEQTTNGNTMTESTFANTKYKTHILDLGIVLGAGYEIPLAKKWSLGIDLRANAGGLNVPGSFDTKGYLDFSNKTKNLNFETGLRVGYTLK